MSPRVSVVMPAYNHRRFVGQAIASVLDQSFRDFELLVVDDGSTDGTPNVIRQFQDVRLMLEVFPANRGAVVAENTAIRSSRGEYIAILNSDDYFLPGKLETQVNFLDANPAVAAVFGLPGRIDERGAPLPGLAEFEIGARIVQSRLEWLRVFFFLGNFLCHPTVMMRRAALDDVGLYDPRLASLPDFDMWVRLGMRHDLRLLHQPLTAFRVLDQERNASRGDENRRRGEFERVQVLKHYRRLAAADLRMIFAADIARFGINPEQSSNVLLSDLAAQGPTGAHQYFALETLFEAYPPLENYRRIHDLARQLNPFAVGAPPKGDVANRGTHRRPR